MAGTFQSNSFQLNSFELEEELTGLLAASETIVDGFAASGSVGEDNSLVAVEAGADILAAAGNAVVSATHATLETGIETSVMGGVVLVTGNAAAVETAVDVVATSSGSGTTAVSGTIFMPGANTLPPSTKKPYGYQPAPVGTVKLVTRAAARSRFTNETHYRSKDLGSVSNMIELSLVEDMSLMTPEGLFVTHHKAIVPAEMISASLMTVPQMKLFTFNLPWNQELRIVKENGDLVAKIYGIRWQIAGGPSETLLSTLGKVTKDKIFTTAEVSFKLSATPADFPTGAVLFVKPRTRRYTLVMTGVTDPVTTITTTGWSIGDLRATVAADSTGWITLPKRNSQVEEAGIRLAGANDAEDQQDAGQDAAFAVPFGPVTMSGGDGLPAEPVGLNTGPDRTLIHLNYSELPNGTMGILNQVFEWAGESSSVGVWKRYA